MGNQYKGGLHHLPLEALRGIVGVLGGVDGEGEVLGQIRCGCCQLEGWEVRQVGCGERREDVMGKGPDVKVW